MGRPKLEKIKCSYENCDNDAYGFYEGKKYCSKHLRQLKKYGDSLDNRKSNLRVCSHRENMKNIRKKDKVIGVSIKKDGRYTSRIMNNYKTLNLGIFETYEEAVLARITKEYELCGEYGPNKDLFYVLNLPYPLEELSKIFQKGV